MSCWRKSLCPFIFSWLLKNFTFSSWSAAPGSLLRKRCPFFCVSLLPVLIKPSSTDASGPCANFAAFSLEVSALLLIPSLWISPTSTFSPFHSNTIKSQHIFHFLTYSDLPSHSFSYRDFKFSFSSFSHPLLITFTSFHAVCFFFCFISDANFNPYEICFTLLSILPEKLNTNNELWAFRLSPLPCSF